MQEPQVLDSNAIVSLRLRGKTFTKEELEIIRSCVEEHYDKGRTKISLAVCKALEWTQPNGWPKDRACRDVLLQLEGMGLIKLPPSLVKRKENSSPQKTRYTKLPSDYDINSSITEFPTTIKLEFAKGNQAEQAWNYIVDKHHYLGHSVVVGRCIKYLITAGQNVLGAICFSSSVWHLAPRDNILTQIGIDKAEIRDYVINNSRFLILPNVTVPNLASFILALASNRVVDDWTWYYSITPKVAETFVQPSQFLGTSYKAANWIEVGTTKGYAKKGSLHHNGQEPKRIFLYGLDKITRRKLSETVRKNSQ